MGDFELTPSEKAEIEQRKANLKAEIERMDDTELKLLAARVKVDAGKYPKPEDLAAAIELKAEQDAIDGVKAIRTADEEEAAMIATADDKRSEQERAIRRLHADFSADVPQEARGGSFEPGEDHPRFGGKHPVADGKYRPAGASHVYAFKKGRLVSVTEATATNNYGGKGVVSVE